MTAFGLETIQKYQARKRQWAKPPLLDAIYKQAYYCPNCELFIAHKWEGNRPWHCRYCGQTIDWSGS